MSAGAGPRRNTPDRQAAQNWRSGDHPASFAAPGSPCRRACCFMRRRGAAQPIRQPRVPSWSPVSQGPHAQNRPVCAIRVERAWIVFVQIGPNCYAVARRKPWLGTTPAAAKGGSLYITLEPVQ